MLLLSVRGFLDYAGPTVHSRLAWLPCCLPPTRNEVGVLIYGLFAAQWPRPPMPLVYASKDTSRCPLQDSRSGWIRYFLSCRALASPTTCRFIPALSGLPVTQEESSDAEWRYNARRMSLSPGTKLGPYEIQALLGAGGMGEVYRARDTRLERTVAIKVLPAHLSSDLDLKHRLEREARAISSLNHPHICTLYDIGTQEG